MNGPWSDLSERLMWFDMIFLFLLFAVVTALLLELPSFVWAGSLVAIVALTGLVIWAIG